MLFKVIDQTSNSGGVGAYRRCEPSGTCATQAATLQEHPRLLRSQIKFGEAAIKRRAHIL
jgi:hypothetical protein